ncbi:hypothetical protein U4E84_01020 [Halorubrum sp. AD140]|uniref:hypothetical protein n=1 Tax=Halorubrum sp. AD140 TaxID=3050073 RepID=UPI002ACC73E5|nr:hypothetical protein [Halorubrum sp. AD140]MDZ5809935.1 hypothetical protein [Halorubrum sp. AD140]
MTQGHHGTTSPRPEVTAPGFRSGTDDRADALRFRAVVDAALDASTGHRTERLRDTHRSLPLADTAVERFAPVRPGDVELPRNEVRQS